MVYDVQDWNLQDLNPTKYDCTGKNLMDDSKPMDDCLLARLWSSRLIVGHLRHCLVLDLFGGGVALGPKSTYSI